MILLTYASPIFKLLLLFLTGASLAIKFSELENENLKTGRMSSRFYKRPRTKQFLILIDMVVEIFHCSFLAGWLLNNAENRNLRKTKQKQQVRYNLAQIYGSKIVLRPFLDQSAVEGDSIFISLFL